MRLLALPSLSLLLMGCDVDSILEADNPDIVPSDIASDPDNLSSLRNGALFEFARALTGPGGSNDYPGIIGTTAVFTDEGWYSSTFTQMRQIDARTIPEENGAILTVFRYAQRARNWAEIASSQFAGSPQANTADHALVTNLAGYSHFLLADNFCSGVPLSRTTIEGDLEFESGQTTSAVFEIALSRFTDAAAIAQAAGDQHQLDLARVGQARALLNLGRISEAASVAAQVTPGFVHSVDYSDNASGQFNGIWAQINSQRRASIASSEGSVNLGLNFFNRGESTAADMTIDPRVPVLSRTIGSGTQFPVFRTGKYDERGRDIPVASYVEAQLIVAEGLLDHGNSNAYLAVLNELRADVESHLEDLGVPITGEATLAPLTDPGTPEERILQLYEERAFWLHLTGQRLGDLRRLIRHYEFNQNEVFPTGITIIGWPIGTDVNFPVPFIEGNNPEIDKTCIDRNA